MVLPSKKTNKQTYRQKLKKKKHQNNHLDFRLSKITSYHSKRKVLDFYIWMFPNIK